MATRSVIGELRAPIDGASLGVFRAGYGLMMLVSIIRFWSRGWIEQLYIEPKLFFPYWGFSWVEPWSGNGMYVHFAILGALAALVMVGIYSRAALVLFSLGFAYVELIDRTTYLNHYYLISLLGLLLAFMPVDRTFSVSRRLGWTGAPATVPRWCVYALRTQVGLVYVFAGLAKLRGDWLLRAEPLHTWLSVHADIPLIGPLLAETAFAYGMSWAGALFDLCIVAFLLWRPTRGAAYMALVVFHAVTGLLFPIGVFPVVMALSATIFFEPNWPRRFFGKAEALHDSSSDRCAVRRVHKLGFVLLAMYFAVQLALPLRHLLYPGSTPWTEQGFRFAWHVMLIEKTGQVDMRVVDNRDGRSWVVYPREHLSRFQYRMMSTQPDMILSFAHHLEREWNARGHADVSVYADAWASLNTRPRQRLIDPDVDLSAQREGWANKAWIVPLHN